MSPRLDWLPIRGASMWPVLREGDEAALTGITPLNPVAEGDVVVARMEDRLMVHRVVRLLGEGDGTIVLRGDGAHAEDAPVPPAALLAKVHRVRRGGRVLLRHEWDTPFARRLSLLARVRAGLGQWGRAR